MASNPHHNNNIMEEEMQSFLEPAREGAVEDEEQLNVVSSSSANSGEDYDESSTIITSSSTISSSNGGAWLTPLRRPTERTAISYDSLTYSTDGSTTTSGSTNLDPNNTSFASSGAGSSTVMSSEQLIHNLKKKQQQRRFSNRQQLLPHSYQSNDHLYNSNYDLMMLQSYSTAGPTQQSSYQQQQPNNVYRSQSMIGRLLYRRSNNDDDDGTQQRQQQQQLLYPSLCTPRFILTVAVCLVIVGNLVLGPGHDFIESILELGVRGTHAQRRATQVQQAKLIPTTSSLLKPLTFKHTKALKTKGDGDKQDKTTTDKSDSCEATVMLLRHCEKGNLKSHCSYMGYERSVFLATLFGNTEKHRWPIPSAIYALNTDRSHKLNFREVETVQFIANEHDLKINRDYSTFDTKDLANDLLSQIMEGSLCGKLVLISWKHSDIPKLAQHLGCGPLEGCPWDYKGKDFDSTWQIRYVFTDFYNSKTGQSKKKWNVFGNVQPENFDPLAFSKSVGDYRPGGTDTSSTLGQWGQDEIFVIYG